MQTSKHQPEALTVVEKDVYMIRDCGPRATTLLDPTYMKTIARKPNVPLHYTSSSRQPSTINKPLSKSPVLDYKHGVRYTWGCSNREGKRRAASPLGSQSLLVACWGSSRRDERETRVNQDAIVLAENLNFKSCVTGHFCNYFKIWSHFCK